MTTPTRLRLESRPTALRPLTDPEAERLDEAMPGIPSVKHCITCGGSKVFLWKDPQGRPAEYDCPCIDQRIMHRYFLHCGLDVLYHRLGWDDADQVDKAVMDRALAYTEHIDAHIRTGQGLILRGKQTGTGKTLIAALLFKQILSMGKDGYFTTFSDMLDANAVGWRNEEERRWFIKRVRNAGVLVIDDVGRENKDAGGKSLGMVESTFDQIIRARHNSCKPTIITTNETEETFSARYRANIMSLLSGICDVIEVPGQDWRDRKADARLDEAKQGLSRPIVVW